METQLIINIALVGMAATLCLDLWNLALKRIFGVQSLNFCLLGRWVCHMPAGRVWHQNIANAERKTAECVVGWLTHYAIGFALTGAFIGLVSTSWLERPQILPALLFGIATVALPLFILQPALGMGIASSKTQNPTRARLKSLMTHSVFGVGLWLCALAHNSLLTPYR